MMIIDSKITTLTKELNDSGYKFILITEKTNNSDPSSRMSSATYSIDDSLTDSFVTLAATLAREAKDRPELMQLLRLTNDFINDADNAFLNNCVQEVK